MLRVAQLGHRREWLVELRSYPEVRLRGHWRWLAPALSWLIARLGGVACWETYRTVCVPAEIQIGRQHEDILAAIRAIQRATGRRPAAIMLGGQHLAELKIELGQSCCLTSARVEDQLRIFDLPVILNPWMEGAIVLPHDALAQVARAPLEFPGSVK